MLDKLIEKSIDVQSSINEDELKEEITDVYDNFLFYVKENNIPEIDRCKILANLIKKYRREEWNDNIFKIICKYKKGIKN